MSWLDRLDDWANPIAVKELRQAVRGKFVAVALILSLIGQLLAVAFLSVTTTLRSSTMAAVQPAGPTAFMMLYAVLFTVCIFLIPAYSGFRMAAERAEANIDLLFITTIKPRTIVFGKLTAIVALVVLLFSASLPFLVFSYVLRGVDFISILVLMVIALVMVISQSVVALFIGSLPASKPFKILLAAMFFLATLMTYPPVLAFAGQVMRTGVGSFGMGGRFWAGFGAFVAWAVSVAAILLVATIAMITPAVANRALPIRLMVAGMWALAFVGAAIVTVGTARTGLLNAWAIGFTVLISLVLLSAAGERESWAPRVARTIPHGGPRRALAFLFYSGSGGGILWSLLFYAATIVFYNLADGWAEKTYTVAVGNNITRGLADAALCMLGYALTATFLRRKLLTRIPARVTWAIALGLFLILSIVPSLIAFAMDAETNRFGDYIQLATMANPFPLSIRSAELRTWRTLMLIAWAAVGLMTNGS